MRAKNTIMSGKDGPGSGDSDVDIAVKPREKTKRPPMYKVLLLNDDFTPMEFVVTVLETFFNLNRENATRIMLNVHTEGKGVCGAFSKDIAETKTSQVNEFSREHNHPLLCTTEEV